MKIKIYLKPPTRIISFCQTFGKKIHGLDEIVVEVPIVLQQFDHLRCWLWRLRGGELPEDGD